MQSLHLERHRETAAELEEARASPEKRLLR
jgi:hypothetical protein